MQDLPTQVKAVASKTYLKAFWLRGIPQEYTVYDILPASNDAVGSHANIEVYSLASDPCRHNKKIATLESPNVPDQILEEAAKDGWTLHTRPLDTGWRLGRRSQMIMDTHFHGFTPLHSSEKDEHTVEYVVVIYSLNFGLIHFGQYRCHIGIGRSFFRFVQTKRRKFHVASGRSPRRH